MLKKVVVLPTILIILACPSSNASANNETQNIFSMIEFDGFNRIVQPRSIAKFDNSCTANGGGGNSGIVLNEATHTLRGSAGTT